MKQLLNTRILNVQLFIWLAFFLSSLLFILFPQIDIYTSSLFYHNGFYLKGSLYEHFFYKSVPIVLITLGVGTLGLFLYNSITKKNIFNLGARTFLYIVLLLGLAPGLLVNTAFKQHWGRARPVQIKEFGGDKTFTPAFILSDQGGHSFSSGHGAAAFSVLGFALLMKRRRKLWIGLALGYGVAVSFARIIAGGHFLSDNVTSFFVVYITTYILYHYIIEKKQ